VKKDTATAKKGTQRLRPGEEGCRHIEEEYHNDYDRAKKDTTTAKKGTITIKTR